MTNKNIYISAKDVAENAKLNHEIAEELRKYKRRHPDVEQSETEGSSQNKESKLDWILRTKVLRMTCLLSTFLLPTLAQAEFCTATPDCKSLGYTQSSCPDGGGVKCPWNTSLMYCPQCKQKDVCQSCKVGMILNSDMTCSAEKASGKTPIGVVSQQTITTVGAAIKCQGVAVALSNFSGTMNWSNANYQSNSYSASGVSGWRLPTKDELLAVYRNSSAVSSGLTAAGGSQFISNWYWSSSSYDYDYLTFYIVNPVSGTTRDASATYGGSNYFVRPVLGF